MNTPLRRVAIAVMVMVVALLANATYVQVIKADNLRADPRNSRVLLDEYSRQRGQISAAGQVLAASVPTDDRYKYLRTYPPNPAAPSSPLANAPVTGFYSMQYGSTGLERTEDPVLNGSDNRLFGRRFFDLVSGRDPPRRQRGDHHQPGHAAGCVRRADGEGLHRFGRGDRAEHRTHPHDGQHPELRPQLARQS